MNLTKEGLRIPYEVSDGITLATLQDSLVTLQEEIRAHLEDNVWMHPDDYALNTSKWIPALQTLIKYYGG